MTTKNTTSFTPSTPPPQSVAAGQTISASVFIAIVNILIEQINHVHSFQDDYS